jgi:orotate phosphoribosyltransferase
MPAFSAAVERDDRQILRAALTEQAFKLGEGWQKNGGKCSWFLDCREIALDGRVLPSIGRLLWKIIRRFHPDVIGGKTVSADPLVAAVLCAAAAESVHVKGFIMRSEPKGYGMRKQFEGPPIVAGDRAVIVDDLISSGATVVNVAHSLRERGVDVCAAVGLVDLLQGGSAALLADGIEPHFLFDLSDLGITADPCAPEPLKPTWRCGPGNAQAYCAPHASPAIDGERVIFCTDTGAVGALTTDGEELWRIRLPALPDGGFPGIHSSPDIRQGALYVGADDGYLYSLASDNGTARWRTWCGCRVNSSPVVSADGSEVVVAANLAENAGILAALSAERGEFLWRARLTGRVQASPAIDDALATVVCGDDSGHVAAFDAGSGAPKWRYRAGGPLTGRLTIDNQKICYACSLDGSLYALELPSGELRWSRKLATRLYSTPRIFGDSVIVGGDSHVVCLARESGSIRWVYPVDGRVIGGAVPCGKSVVAVGCADGRVLALTLDDGRPVSIMHTGSAILSSVAISSGGVLVACPAGPICGFRMRDFVNKRVPAGAAL